MDKIVFLEKKEKCDSPLPKMIIYISPNIFSWDFDRDLLVKEPFNFDLEYLLTLYNISNNDMMIIYKAKYCLLEDKNV